VAEQGTHKPLVGGSNPPSATTPSPLDVLADAVARGSDAAGLPPDGHVVLAVSGGPDSVALLHGAVRLVGRGARAWRVTVAHLDHGLRAESADDARFVSDTATALGVPTASRRVDVDALAREERRSLEDAGREARYRFFAEIAGHDGWVATGHTADDAAETVLLNLMRGSGTRGVRGITAQRDRLVRPLLGERRDTIRSLLDDASVAYRVDPSNVDPAYLRNRVRRELLPLMEAIRPGAVARIVQFAAHAAADDALLDDVAAAELARRTTDGGLDWRTPPPRALGRRVLRLAIGPPAPAAERIEALLDAAEGVRGGLVIELGGGRSASVRERRIALARSGR
jgi:tRNA(Ile)-lysidine synthase